MAVFFVFFLDSSVFSRFFRVFFQIVHRGMRYHTRGGHSVTHMVGKRYAAVTAVFAVDFPRGSGFSGEEVLVPAFGLRQATGDCSDF